MTATASRRRAPSSSRTRRTQSKRAKRTQTQTAEPYLQKKSKCLAALFLGDGVRETSRRFKVPESTIRGWRDALTPEQVAQIRAVKGQRLNELIVEHVEESLVTLRAISEAVRSPKFIQRQNADDVGVLYGIIHDKTVRLIEASQRQQFDDSGDTGGELSGNGADRTEEDRAEGAHNVTPAAPSRQLNSAIMGVGDVSTVQDEE